MFMNKYYGLELMKRNNGKLAELTYENAEKLSKIKVVFERLW